MSQSLTLALLAGAIVLAIFSGWRGARPPDPRKGPRLIPWRFLMLLSAALTMLLLIHLAALLGGGPPPAF